MLKKKDIDLIEKEILKGESILEHVSKSNNTSQMEALTTMLAGRNTFLSGPAGSGKSHIIKILSKMLDKKKIFITSTTGYSAVTIGGITIHSYGGLYPGKKYDFDDIDNLDIPYKVRRNIKQTDILIIDEISMMSSFQLNLLLKIIKHVRGRAWKKIQFIVSGDFGQLSPVKTSKDEELMGEFCFLSDAWKEIGFTPLYMDRVYRAEDEELKKILDKISSGNAALEDMKNIKRIDSEDIWTTEYPILSSKNYEVNIINNKRQEMNPSKKIIDIEPVPSPKFNKDENERFIKEMNIPKETKIKDGDTVMITLNETDSISFGACTKKNAPLLKNGMIGTVNIDNNNKVSFKYSFEGIEYVYSLGPAEFRKTISRFDTFSQKMIQEEIAGFSMIPLKLAYSISIHKSQGQTYSHLLCNLSDCWTDNLGYVAISRIKTLDGLAIISYPMKEDINKQALMINPMSLKVRDIMLKKTKTNFPIVKSEKISQWIIQNIKEEK